MVSINDEMKAKFENDIFAVTMPATALFKIFRVATITTNKISAPLLGQPHCCLYDSGKTSHRKLQKIFFTLSGQRL